MKFSIRFADKIVGTLVVLAIAMLIVVVFMLGKSQRWFVKDLQYKSFFPSAKGLSVNMNVQYKGFTIGHVKKFALADDDMVEVRFTIFEEHSHRVKEGSIVELQSSPIGLGNSFLFYPGKGKNVLDEGAVIPELNSLQASMLIKTGLADTPISEDSIGNIINQVGILIEALNQDLGKILEDVKTAVGKATGIINDLSGQVEPIISGVDDLTKVRIPEIMTNVTAFTDKLSDPKELVMTLLDKDGPVLNNLTGAFDSIASIMGSLEKTIEFIPEQLPQIAILLSQLQTALAEAEKLITALNNHPLLKGGVPEVKETGPGAATPRDLDFKN